jgi:hypothetical protein
VTVVGAGVIVMVVEGLMMTEEVEVVVLVTGKVLVGPTTVSVTYLVVKDPGMVLVTVRV